VLHLEDNKAAGTAAIRGYRAGRMPAVRIAGILPALKQIFHPGAFYEKL
jgi:hypothetical protein